MYLKQKQNNQRTLIEKQKMDQKKRKQKKMIIHFHNFVFFLLILLQHNLNRALVKKTLHKIPCNQTNKTHLTFLRHGVSYQNRRHDTPQLLSL